MKINKKAFTLIETLAVVVILGILTSTAVVGYSKYKNKAQQDYYDKQTDLVTQAGRDYFNDNRGKLPQVIGEESCVILDTLVTNRYIDKVLDYNKNTCSNTNSKVCARKIDTSKFIYSGYLDCGEFNYITPEYQIPRITFTPSSGTKKNESINVTMKIDYSDTTNVTNLASYRYQIFEQSSSTAYYDTGWKTIKGSKKEFTTTVKLDSDGIYYIIGMAYNEKGKFISKKSGNFSLDFKINCSTDITITPQGYNYGDWTKDGVHTKFEFKGGVKSYDIQLVNKNTNIEIGNKDSGKVVTRELTKTMNVEKDGIYIYKVTGYDKYGTGTCVKTSGDYKIDKTPPRCEVISSTEEWVKDQVILTAKCTDYESGCKQKETKKTFTLEPEELLYKFENITDKVGNEADCKETEVLLDQTPPMLKVTTRKCNDKSSINACLNSEQNGYSSIVTSKENQNREINITNTTSWISEGMSSLYEVEDEKSGYDHVVWEYNKSKDFSNLADLSTGGSSNHPGETGKLTLTGAGKRQGKITAYDKVGNKSSVTVKGNITYLLTYDNNGGTGCTTLKAKISNGTPVWNGLCTPNRTNYIFDGWYTEATGGTKVTNNQTATKDMKVYAHWVQPVYKITLDLKGGAYGTDVIYEKYGVGYYLNEEATSSVNSGALSPTRTGYNYGGYYTSTNGNGTNIINSSGSVIVPNTYFRSDSTIYAKWTPKVYMITLDRQGGTGGTGTIYLKYNTGWYSNSSATTSISSITKPTKTGYDFKGYFTSTGGSGTQIINSSSNIVSGNTTKFTSNSTIYAHWKGVSSTIQYKPGSGSGTMSNQTCYYNENCNLKSNSFTAPSGYTFNGWKINSTTYSSGTNIKNLLTTTGTTITATAQWKELTPSVTCSPKSTTWSNSSNTISITGSNISTLYYKAYSSSSYKSKASPSFPFTLTSSTYLNYVYGTNAAGTSTSVKSCYAYVDTLKPYTPHIVAGSFRGNTDQVAGVSCNSTTDLASLYYKTSSIECIFVNKAGDWTSITPSNYTLSWTIDSTDQPSTSGSGSSLKKQLHFKGWFSTTVDGTPYVHSSDCTSNGHEILRRCQTYATDNAGNTSAYLNVYPSVFDKTQFSNGTFK